MSIQVELILQIVTISTQLVLFYYVWAVIHENKRLWKMLDGEFSEVKLIITHQ